jgi:shikimate kinase
MTDKHALPQNLILIGFMGSGKSSVGRMLASRLGFRFTDTDSIVEHEAGASIRDIFHHEGEEGFRRHETAALESLVGHRRMVVATGGGVVTQERNLAILHRLGWVVLLRADPEEIYKRVSRNKDRPLLQTADPHATLLELLSAREPLYRAAAQYTVDSTGMRKEHVVDLITLEARKVFGWKLRPAGQHHPHHGHHGHHHNRNHHRSHGPSSSERHRQQSNRPKHPMSAPQRQSAPNPPPHEPDTE